MTLQVCPLCKRPIDETNSDLHHLIPRTFGGKQVVRLHKICHQYIHGIISERELANYYHTIERLLEHEKIQNFVKWVAKKPPDFYEKTKDSNERRNKRRR